MTITPSYHHKSSRPTPCAHKPETANYLLLVSLPYSNLGQRGTGQSSSLHAHDLQTLFGVPSRILDLHLSHENVQELKIEPPESSPAHRADQGGKTDI
jgi:hypothetical protein